MSQVYNDKAWSYKYALCQCFAVRGRYFNEQELADIKRYTETGEIDLSRWDYRLNTYIVRSIAS